MSTARLRDEFPSWIPAFHKAKTTSAGQPVWIDVEDTGGPFHAAGVDPTVWA